MEKNKRGTNLALAKVLDPLQDCLSHIHHLLQVVCLCGCSLFSYLFVCLYVLSLPRPSPGAGWHHKPICFYVPSLNCICLCFMS